MKIEKEELFLGFVSIPLFACLAILLATVKAPSDIFRTVEQKAKSKTIRKVEVKTEAKKEETPVISAPSLSQSLAAPSSLGSDLKSLSAGVVSEGSGGSGGMNITQGESNTQALVQSTGGESRPARAVAVVNPIYPQSAQARGIEGFVILEILVSERGLVTEAKVISANPEGLFDQVAIEAIKKWSFEPGINNGQTVASRIKQKVNFELN